MQSDFSVCAAGKRESNHGRILVWRIISYCVFSLVSFISKRKRMLVICGVDSLVLLGKKDQDFVAI